MSIVWLNTELEDIQYDPKIGKWVGFDPHQGKVVPLPDQWQDFDLIEHIKESDEWIGIRVDAVPGVTGKKVDVYTGKVIE